MFNAALVLNSIADNQLRMIRHSNSFLLSSTQLIVLLALLVVGFSAKARADDQCASQIVSGGVLVAYYYDGNDILIAAEELSVMRTVKPSSRFGLALLKKTDPLPQPPAGPFQAAGVAATAVYVLNSRPDPTKDYEYNKIVAVEDMSGVTDRTFQPIEQSGGGSCKCSTIPCPQGQCCPRKCM